MRDGEFWILEGDTPVEVGLYDARAVAFLKKPGAMSIAVSRVGESRVSTCFLVVDHAMWGGPPLLFETMVFDGPMHLECVRYSTIADAREGHERMVERVKNWKPEAEGEP